MIVLDASVLAKLFVCEAGSDAARRLIDQETLFLGPALVRLEVASAITRKVRNAELTRSEAEAALASWRAFTALGYLRLTPDEALLPDAEPLSLSLRHPLADCLYLALAAQHQLPLVTADQPLIDAAETAFPNIRHLNDT